MRKGLIIRCVSFQILDKAIHTINENFNGNIELHLLTHSHAISRAEKYEVFKKIIPYKRKGNFSFFHIPEEAKKTSYDYLFIPLSNSKGYGFLNIFSMSLKIKTEQIFLVLPDGKIKSIKKSKLLKIILKDSIYFAFSILIGTLFSIFYVLKIMLELSLKRINHVRKKEKKSEIKSRGS